MVVVPAASVNGVAAAAEAPAEAPADADEPEPPQPASRKPHDARTTVSDLIIFCLDIVILINVRSLDISSCNPLGPSTHHPRCADVPARPRSAVPGVFRQTDDLGMPGHIMTKSVHFQNQLEWRPFQKPARLCFTANGGRACENPENPWRNS
ncbi:hypothetical protein [Paraburkholderia sp. J41]|uniref:hypothetical protein n=1 Tax=Paraburkholderia sp. J41 TaxID=2805433 RepID=UPI002AC32952|nr:hypothetical protein [Paraburkholderia sp. J41]